ncbi:MULTISPECIES: autotransporter outer membrane beta-barrel domain-containing protein [unclassified Stenotrophomonas]|uniref:autotransporter outer membrane beta-barrel domain-containing protein n=1 Tax=unclassified Stenotrophomonas TaxID=196198 RepID=UPI002118CE24|nr:MULTISPECIES: autotransporter outer membrane beta-barrel domain-containing protein [unclassified Stenotrophomonas]
MIAPASSSQHLLALAIAAALAGNASAALAQHAAPIIADGTREEAAPGEYRSTADGAAGHVLHALNGGSIRASEPVTVTTSGQNTAAVRAERDGSMIFNGGSITTHGDYAIGLSILSGGQVDLLPDAAGQGMVFSTSGYRSPAVEVNGGTLRVRDAIIDTTGYQSHGMAAYYSGHIEGDGLTITTHEAGSAGAVATAGGTFTLSNGSIETLGGAAHGVIGSKAITLRDTDIRVAGRASIAVDFQGGTLWIENGAMQADHPQSTAVRLAAGSQVDIIGTQMGAGFIGLSNGGRSGEARLVDVDIRISSANGAGIWLSSGPRLSMLGGSIITLGDNSRGVDNLGGGVTLEGVQVSTVGASAHGLNAEWDIFSGDLMLEADRIAVDTGGDGAIGALSHSGGTAHLRRSTITTAGANSYGVLSGGTGVMTLHDTHVGTEGLGAAAAVVNANGSLDIDGGSLTSARDAALWVRAARHVAAHNGARLFGGNGTLMKVDAAFAGPLDLSLDQDVYAQGDIVITPDDIGAGVPVVADIHVHLNGRSHWRGASGVVNQVSLRDGSRWTLTGDASVGQLALHDSTLALSAVGAGNFNRLTVDGDLDTHNALLIFNGALAGDDSPIDTLRVRGDTRGTAAIQVNNVHGLGAQTVDGIALIQVEGASDATYALRGRAVAGQYDYFLHKGGVTTPGDGGWYLRATLPTTPDPCDADPDGPGCVTPPDPCDSDPTGPGCIVIPPDPCEADPGGLGCVVPPPDPCVLNPSGPGCALPPTPCEAGNTAPCHRPRPPQVLRPEAGAYLANQAAAVSMFQHRLHDRDGAYASNAAREASWLRVGSTQRRQAVDGQLALSARATTVTSGVDLLHWGAGGQGRAGVLLGTGRAATDVRSQRSGYAATGIVKGTAVGVYATWMHHPGAGDGAYLDGGVQHGRYRSSVQGIALARERQQARTDAATLEAGYAWKRRVRDSATLLVQPQLQLTYTDYRADDLVEHNGTQVAPGAGGRVSSRLGLRMTGDVRSVDHVVQPFVSAHWLRASGSNSIWMDHTRIDGAVPKNRYELRGGAMLQLGMRWSAWGDLGVQRGDGAYRSVSVQMGLRSTW